MTDSKRFEPLPAEVLASIASRGGIKRYPTHAVLITESDSAETLYVILSGRVKVYTANEAGRELILTLQGAGEYLGELALDDGVRSASLMTLEPTTCAVVTGAKLRDFVAAHPGFAHHLIVNLIRRVRRLTGSAKSLALDDVHSRIAALLDNMARDKGAERRVSHKLTQQATAEHIGSSREMVSRVFKELTVGGYVAVQGGRIRLLKKLPAAG